MATGSRQKWLLKQPDDVQLDVLLANSAGASIEAIAAMLKERHGIDVPVSTLHHSLKELGPMFQEERLAAAIARRDKEFFESNPEVTPHGLAKYALKRATATLDISKLSPGSVMAAAQNEACIALRADELEVKREANRIKREQLEHEKTELALKVEKAERERAAVEAAITGGAGQGDEQKDAGKVIERIREIYGLVPAAGDRSAAALPGEVAER